MAKGGYVPSSATISLRASEPPLNPDEFRRLRWGLGCILTLVAAWGVYFFDLSGSEMLPFITALVVAGLLRPALAARVPSWLGRLSFPLLVVGVVADIVIRHEPLATMIRLNLVLMAMRAFGHRRAREDLQVVVLGLLLVIAAGVLTVAIGFVLHLLVFTALALTYLLAITLSRGNEGEGDAWARLEWGRVLGRLRRVVDWRIVAAAGALYLLVVALASVLFLAMPRFQIENSLGLLQLHNRRSFSGFSDTMRLGEVTDIVEDNSTALRVEPMDQRWVPTQPYWRMVVLDEYKDGTFIASRGLRIADQRLGEQRELHGNYDGGSSEAAYTFYFEGGISRYLPLPGNYKHLVLRDLREISVNTRTGVLSLQEEPQSMFAYRIEHLDWSGSWPDATLGAQLSNARGPGFPATLLAVPPGDENLAGLDGILGDIGVADSPTSAVFSTRAIAWLERNHRYSRQSSVPPGQGDVLIRWLRSQQPGHCELFAGAFALLARRAGFPTRVVTGFVGGAWNDLEHYYMVRNANAHAWCEIYDEKGRWQRVDPTPGAQQVAAATAASGRPAELARGWGSRLDALRIIWYRRIVNFDSSSQEQLAKNLRTATRQRGLELMQWLDRKGQALRNWLMRPWNPGRLARFTTVVLFVVALCWAVWRWRLLWWRWLQLGRRRGDPLRREAGRWLRRFRTVSAFAPAVVDDLERIRYGPTPSTVFSLAVFRRARAAWRRRSRQDQ